MNGTRQMRFGVWAVGAMLLAMSGVAHAHVCGDDCAYHPEMEVVGTLEVVQKDDFDRGRSEVEHWIVDHVANRAYRAEFRGKSRPEFETGAVVKARGRRFGDAFVVSNDAGTGESAVQVLSAPSAPSTMASIAVIIVDFADSPVTCSKASIASRMFPVSSQANVADYYAEASNARFGFQADTTGNGYAEVFGPYTISARRADACDYYAWAYEAEAFARAEGADLSLYKHLLFVLPSNTSCSWAGVANVGCGVQCRSWVARCAMDDIYAHELGHNLGLRHASTDTNNDGVIESEYGDNSCVMGFSNVGWRHPNAPNKERLGWFQDYPQQVQEVSQGGVYTLAPLDMAPWDVNAPQVLKLHKADTNEYYYLSYRVRTGYSSALRVQYADKVNIHVYRGWGSVPTKFITALVNGGSLSDSKNGITVTQLSQTSGGSNPHAQVQISFGPSMQAPSIALAPASRTATEAGLTMSYAVSVTNNDDNTMPAATFALSAAVPAGWSAQWNPGSLTLAPGATAMATVSLTPAANAPDGVYGFTLTAADTAGQRPSRSATGQYVLDANPPEPVTGLTGAEDNRGVVQLSWNHSLDGNTVAAAYDVWRDSGSGFEWLANTNSNSYADRDTQVDADTIFAYTVVALDAAGNESDPGDVLEVLIANKTKTNGKGGGNKGGGDTVDDGTGGGGGGGKGNGGGKKN